MLMFKFFMKNLFDILWHTVKMVVLVAFLLAMILLEIEWLLTWFELEVAGVISAVSTVLLGIAYIAWKNAKIDMQYHSWEDK